MEHSKKLPEKISRIILRINNLVVKISININNDTFKSYKETEYAGNLYMTLNLYPTISIEVYKDKNDDVIYDKTTFFPIGQGNIGSVVKTMKKVLKNIYNEDIFAIQNNKIIVYKDMATKYSERITIPKLGYTMLIRPSVVYDENETSYEGVNIYINKTDNITMLSIDEFENLVYTLDKIDMFTYSQLLFNWYISFNNQYEENRKLLLGNTTLESPVRKMIDWSTNVPKVSSNYRKNEEDDDMFKGL